MRYKIVDTRIYKCKEMLNKSSYGGETFLKEVNLINRFNQLGCMLGSNRLGFGLIELMISVFVLVLVVTTAAVFFGYYINNYNFSFQQGQATSEADYLFAMINAEIREMRVSEDGGYPLVSANDNEISFYSDIDNDSVIERVRYFLSGSEILRGAIEPTEESPTYNAANESVTKVASNIRNSTPIFYYFNENWPADTTNNPLPQASRLIETRMVKIDLVINTNPNENEDFKIDTEIMMRNLKTN